MFCFLPPRLPLLLFTVLGWNPELYRCWMSPHHATSPEHASRLLFYFLTPPQPSSFLPDSSSSTFTSPFLLVSLLHPIALTPSSLLYCLLQASSSSYSSFVCSFTEKHKLSGSCGVSKKRILFVYFVLFRFRNGKCYVSCVILLWVLWNTFHLYANFL